MSYKIVSYKITKCEERSGEPKRQYNKLYIWLSDETIIQNLVNRRSRPYTEYKKLVIPLLMDKLKTDHPTIYEKLKNDKWGWNQNCGCSMCPCSPGFIGSYSPYDYYTIDATITNE